MSQPNDFASDLRDLRAGQMRIPQELFAERFGVSYGMLRDQEQGRYRPQDAFKVLVAAIVLDPFLVARAAQMAADRWPD